MKPQTLTGYRKANRKVRNGAQMCLWKCVTVGAVPFYPLHPLLLCRERPEVADGKHTGSMALSHLRKEQKSQGSQVMTTRTRSRPRDGTS